MHKRLMSARLIMIIAAWLLPPAQAQFHSDVYLQGFYWNSPPGGIWYDSLAKLAPRLSSAGFGAIWFPSPVKGGGGMSMGYDPYDHYDFGDYNQKGTVETRFGSRAELERAIRTYHQLGLEVFADAVMNHMNGGEVKTKYQCKPYPSFPDSAFLLFRYPNGSGRFKKDSSYFYPNAVTCDVNPPYHGPDDPQFAFGEWLAKDLPKVRDSLIVWGKFLKQTLGFDGFRLDAVKAIDPAFMGPWLQAVNGNAYAVAEYYGDLGGIMNWHYQTQTLRGGKVAMFDFPLRYTLKDMCNNTGGSFDMNWLDGAGLINSGMSGYDVSTWVENHDVDRIGYDSTIGGTGHDPIITNKDMAYAYIIFSEGRPSVFFKDYFMYGYGGKIDTLIWIRHKYLGGGTTKRGGLNVWYVRQDGNQDQPALSRDVYVARRNGYGSQTGGYLLLNDNPSQWIDVWVDTELPVGAKYKDFTGKDANKTVQPPSLPGGKNRVKLWCPPRTYTLYAGDTATVIANAPAMIPIPDQIAYTNAPVAVKVVAFDINNQPLTFAITGNPQWLSISQEGLISGTPAMGDTGTSIIAVSVTDPTGLAARDTFKLTVQKNLPPRFSALRDTSVKATKRFELQAKAIDPDNDTIIYSFKSAPSFINIGVFSGLMSGTPAVTDTGAYLIKLLASDRKGGTDSLLFTLRVTKSQDSIIRTYGKPFLDGKVNIGSHDWLAQWQVAVDPDTDSRWNPRDTMNNELLGLFATWDADSLYLGVQYVINDAYNTMMLYLDAGIAGGVTNFNSNQGYNGDYAKNFRFRPADGIDFFIADYYRNEPSFFKIDGNTTINLTDSIHGKRGPGGYDMEIAVAWNNLYGRGAGKVPSNVVLKIVSVVAGGFNYGAGDACPDNPDVDGNAGPDSLINLVSIKPDLDGDGLPDPTIILNADDDHFAAIIPSEFILFQNYPNPFNPVTTIKYQTPPLSSRFEKEMAGAMFVSLKVYDVLGREVAKLVDEMQRSGMYAVTFNGSALPSGIYFYELRAGNFSATKKLVLMK